LRRSVVLEAGQVPEAVLRRLVLAADADRRAIERELHEGVHQHLVALAVSLQLARQAVDSDPEAVKSLLEEMRRDVQQALDETALLAQRIYPATVENTGLGALLRSAAVNAGVPASVHATGGVDHPPEVAMTVYLCWLAMLARGSGEGRATIDLRKGEKALAFEIKGQASDSDADLDRLRDRVEALGGRLRIESAPDGAISVSGSLPFSR
jgi:signal transduction histidine kinase